MRIGIILRPDVSSGGKSIHICYDSFVKIIKKYNHIPIGIMDMEGLKTVDRVICQGGDEYNSFDLEAISYCYLNDIPLLGICLGMQTMGVLFDGKLDDIDNHKSTSKYVHEVKINKDSKLYKILNKDVIRVNSRHKSYVKSTKLKVSALSDVIEAIEDSDKKFFIGLQWHPEDMVSYDDLEEKIFSYFLGDL